MIKILKYLKTKQWLTLIMVLILVIFQVWLDLKLPDYMSEITVLIKSESGVMSDILKNGGLMLLCAFGSLIAAGANAFLISVVASKFSKTVREKVFAKVTSLSMREIKDFSSSSLITRTTNDVNQVEMLVAMGAQMFFKAPITAVWAISKILNKSWEWSMLTGVAVIVILSVIAIIFYFVFPKFKVVQTLIDKLNLVTRENLNGIRVVRAFNAETHQETKFKKVSEELTDNQLYTQKKFAIMQPTMMFVMSTLTLAIFFVGAILIKEANLVDRMTLFGNMVVFSSYAMQVIMSFIMLAMIFMMLPRAQISAKRINEVLDSSFSIEEGKYNDDTKEKGLVEFKNVAFKYPDAEECLIKNVSFVAKPGETVAFMGSTGSGKSTLINLIPRFYDVTKGQILIDGIDVREYSEKSLNDKIGYISQTAVIFSGTIEENVSYGRKLSKEKVKEALKVAQAFDFVEKLPAKLKTDLAKGGTNISGGQKQRISIARAIAKNPEIYIFDDSFSALDYKTDLKLRNALKKHTNKATTLIVAQRVGTILNADKIIVLDKGEAVGMGTHKELLKTCEVYREIAYSQLSKEELENA